MFFKENISYRDDFFIIFVIKVIFINVMKNLKDEKIKQLNQNSFHAFDKERRFQSTLNN